MKKSLVVAMAALGMVSATVSFADALNGAAGKKQAAAVEHKEQAKLYPVDVMVLNRTDNVIRVQNVNTLYTLGSGDALRLPSNVNGSVPLYITNGYDGRVLVNANVCNRAIITVKGAYSSVVAYLDNSQCYK